MGILKRFTDIMAANINAILDKAEDPEKMVDQCIRELSSDLSKVKAETASVMADETKAKRELDECTKEIDKMVEYAQKAILAGNDEDAKKFLAKKAVLVDRQTALQQNYEVASANATKMRQMHDKLTKDLNELNARKDAIKAKVKIAKAQEKMNKMTESIGDATSAMTAFNRMEAKADRMLDEAQARAELNAGEVDEFEALSAKYDQAPSAAVDDELAALKASMGL